MIELIHQSVYYLSIRVGRADANVLREKSPQNEFRLEQNQILIGYWVR